MNEEVSAPEPDEPAALIRVLERAGILPDPAVIETRVQALQARSPHAHPRDMARRAIRAHTVRLTGTGVVAALPGSVPFVGEALQTGFTVSVEAWAILRGLAVMQLTVAGLFGHDLYAPERKQEVLLVWGLEAGAIFPAAEFGKRMGGKIAGKQFDERFSAERLRRINRRADTTVFTKRGTKRGGLALGPLVELGASAAVGAGANYLTVRSFGAACLKFYADVEPGGE